MTTSCASSCANILCCCYFKVLEQKLPSLD